MRCSKGHYYKRLYQIRYDLFYEYISLIHVSTFTFIIIKDVKRLNLKFCFHIIDAILIHIPYVQTYFFFIYFTRIIYITDFQLSTIHNLIKTSTLFLLLLLSHTYYNLLTSKRESMLSFRFNNSTRNWCCCFQ